MSFLTDLLAGAETRVDSLVVSALAGTFALIALQAYVTAQDHVAWSPIAFGTGVATIIGAAHTAKAYRDRGADNATDPKP